MMINDVLTQVYSYYQHFGHEIIYQYDNGHQPSMIKGWKSRGFFQGFNFKDEIGAGIAKADVELFLNIKNECDSIKNIYIIGNSFGFSTFVLSTIFPDARIDVIDAEIEGDRNKDGSELTRKIIKEYGLDILLTIGFSPTDNSIAMRSEYYDLVFVDGLHTPKQLGLDLNGIINHTKSGSYIVCHDLGVWKQLWFAIRDFLENNNEYVLHSFNGVEYLNTLGTIYLTKR